MAIQPQATRSLRRIRVRTPGNNLVMHFEKRKSSIAKCAKCRSELKGIPRGVSSEIRNLPLSQKTVSRPFGGNLCSKCSREEIISKFKEIKEIPLEIGQVCVKISGREAGQICIIVNKLDENFVLIDGQTRRRKCNIFHLKTLDKKVEIKKNETSENIKKELKKLGYEVKEKKVKEKAVAKENKKEANSEKKNEPRTSKKVR